MDINLKNTRAWLKEYTVSVDIRDIPELSFLDMPADSIKTKSLIMLPNFSATLAVVLTFKVNASMLIVPLSQYTSPSSDLELLLPESKFVACTWNARMLKKSEAGDILNLGFISDADFNVMSKHYMAIFQKGVFSKEYSELIGSPIASMGEMEKKNISAYFEDEYSQLPEDTFTSLQFNLNELFQEALESSESSVSFEFETKEETKEEAEASVFDFFPGSDIESESFELRNAASKKPDDTEEDDSTK